MLVGTLCPEPPELLGQHGLQASASEQKGAEKDGPEQDASFWFYFPVSIDLLGELLSSTEPSSGASGLPSSCGMDA